MTEAETLICPVCAHTKAEHLEPSGGRIYWRCQHWIGHPWDGPCECRELVIAWIPIVKDPLQAS